MEKLYGKVIFCFILLKYSSYDKREEISTIGLSSFFFICV